VVVCRLLDVIEVRWGARSGCFRVLAWIAGLLWRGVRVRLTAVAVVRAFLCGRGCVGGGAPWASWSGVAQVLFVVFCCFVGGAWRAEPGVSCLGRRLGRPRFVAVWRVGVPRVVRAGEVFVPPLGFVSSSGAGSPVRSVGGALAWAWSLESGAGFLGTNRRVGVGCGLAPFWCVPSAAEDLYVFGFFLLLSNSLYNSVFGGG